LRKLSGSFLYFARFQAGGAHADALVGALHPGVHGAQIDVPAAAAHVMGVADLVAKLRTLTADITNLCHFRDSRFFDSEELRRLQSIWVKARFYSNIEI
jgi:hypothetical protein